MTRLKSWTTSPVKACDRYGQLDVLINNAGIMPVSLLDDLRVQDWENMITLANGKEVTRPRASFAALARKVRIAPYKSFSGA
jgi:NADP-dependent 3-hydroxy acid dehydrogenase YdfG